MNPTICGGFKTSLAAVRALTRLSAAGTKEALMGVDENSGVERAGRAAAEASKKRGRPKRVGRQGWELARAIVAVEVYQRPRVYGIKYEVALQEAVDEVRKAFPGARTSVTTIKKILAEFMSTKEGFESALVTKTPGREITGQRFDPTGVTYFLCVGPRPAYRRANEKHADRN